MPHAIGKVWRVYSGSGSTNDPDNFECVVNGQVPPDLEAYMQSAPRFNQAP